jgi:hypothetical protein
MRRAATVAAARRRRRRCRRVRGAAAALWRVPRPACRDLIRGLLQQRRQVLLDGLRVPRGVAAAVRLVAGLVRERAAARRRRLDGAQARRRARQLLLPLLLLLLMLLQSSQWQPCAQHTRGPDATDTRAHMRVNTPGACLCMRRPRPFPAAQHPHTPPRCNGARHSPASCVMLAVCVSFEPANVIGCLKGREHGCCAPAGGHPAL